MKFWEAMKALQEGKKVRERDWQEDLFIYLNDDIVYDSRGNIHRIISKIGDNWELYNKKINKQPIPTPFVVNKQGQTLEFSVNYNSEEHLKNHIESCLYIEVREHYHDLCNSIALGLNDCDKIINFIYKHNSRGIYFEDREVGAYESDITLEHVIIDKNKYTRITITEDEDMMSVYLREAEMIDLCNWLENFTLYMNS